MIGAYKMIAWYDINGKKYNSIDGFVDAYKKYYSDNSAKLKPHGKAVRVFNKDFNWDFDLHDRLGKDGVQSVADLRDIIEWKTGWKFDKKTTMFTPQYATENEKQKSFSSFFDAIIREIHMCSFSDISSCENAKEAFKRLYAIKENSKNDAKGIGPVYILSILYFLSKFEWPVYDRYAHIACIAIRNNIAPPSRVKYVPPDGSFIDWVWDDYQEYCDLLCQIFGTHSIKRDDDIALWVYGHCFNHKIPAKKILS